MTKLFNVVLGFVIVIASIITYTISSFMNPKLDTIYVQIENEYVALPNYNDTYIPLDNKEWFAMLEITNEFISRIKSGNDINIVVSDSIFNMDNEINVTTIYYTQNAEKKLYLKTSNVGLDNYEYLSIYKTSDDCEKSSVATINGPVLNTLYDNYVTVSQANLHVVNLSIFNFITRENIDNFKDDTDDLSYVFTFETQRFVNGSYDTYPNSIVVKKDGTSIEYDNGINLVYIDLVLNEELINLEIK